MARLKIFGAICAAPIIVLIGAAVLAAVSPNLALAGVSVVALVSLYARRSPLPRLGLISRGVANAALVGAMLGLFAAFGGYQVAERDRLAALAASDPDAYLAEMRTNDEDRWLQELQRLDPSAYQVEIDRRETTRRQEIERRETERRQEIDRRETERRQKIAALEEEVRGIPASEYESNLRIYERLAKLVPDDERYENKVTHYRARIKEAKQRRKQSAAQSSSQPVQADPLADAYRLCAVFENTGLTTECDVSAWGSTVDVRIDTTGSEAREICSGVTSMMAERTRSFRGKWELRIFSPFSGDHPIAKCRLS